MAMSKITLGKGNRTSVSKTKQIKPMESTLGSSQKDKAVKEKLQSTAFLSLFLFLFSLSFLSLSF
jgi:hypothetical protein